ncbi:hypothetical protein A2966_00460 [Candidatus Roizmanbacteria bacterium RIFCSPLOWO2_01_FULL_41_22]|uniref:DUF458 domain-containing protein n=2 Tax=Candidatus Roizmaniibacteriota TaxID=1752723 RepID=A0A1F7JQK8_9BACT|nr:MAG: hypothetical protein A2966_00460 [Candidatus Roizmanbacteria bacterium RIFCSPLOWO2_01_FULL_41_22]OGK57885.1 MAG: hypothetical protein A3H86_01065 [Candidatus Roizmanbacteria bacterium RIFCSPLOWO2_02_FULL_41_9]
MIYHSPTHGKVSFEELKKIVHDYMADDKLAKYEIVVGSDSQKTEKNQHDFISALIVHRVGGGGIYFWKRQIITRTVGLKERIYLEATMSLATSEHFLTFFRENGIAKYDIQIHVDIGHKGKTREMISEVVSMIRANGYDIRIKPESYGASKVADKYT